MTSGEGLWLGRRERLQLAREAARAHPEECCGLLLGRRSARGGARVERACATANASTGDRRRSFAIDPLDLLALLRLARARGQEVVGVYHSHPDGGWRPSVRDRDAAWAGWSYVIVTPEGGLASWRRRADGGLAAEELIDTSPVEGAA